MTNGGKQEVAAVGHKSYAGTRFAEIIQGVKFKDGEKLTERAA